MQFLEDPFNLSLPAKVDEDYLGFSLFWPRQNFPDQFHATLRRGSPTIHSDDP